MTLASLFHTLSLVLQVSLLDLILSGDNAVVIALSCRKLPPRQMKQAMLLGSGAAIGLRVLLTTMVSMLLQVAMLKLIGAVLLVVIAIRLLIAEEHAGQPADQTAPSGLWGAVMTVLVADAVMSLDNVVALAAVTQGSILYLILGLVLSVGLLMVSSTLMIDLLQRYPLLIPAAGALLGYVAGDIAVSDPAIVNWVGTQSPALTGLVPLLCAVFVVAQSRIIERRRRELPRPAALAERVPSPPAAALAVAPARAAAMDVPPSTREAATAGEESKVHAVQDAAAAPVGELENARPTRYLGLGKLIGNRIIQAMLSILLAIFCIVFLPKALDVVILIGIVALMLFKIF
jgi:YjbE family integral membrane protein